MNQVSQGRLVLLEVRELEGKMDCQVNGVKPVLQGLKVNPGQTVSQVQEDKPVNRDHKGKLVYRVQMVRLVKSALGVRLGQQELQGNVGKTVYRVHREKQERLDQLDLKDKEVTKDHKEHQDL